MAAKFVRETWTEVSASVSRPADNTAYAAGDHIANSTTAGSVVPITFTTPGHGGRVTGCRCIVTPASGNLVITNLTFDLLLFRPATNIPFTAGSYPADNAAMAITAAAYREAVAVFNFVASGWRNPAGAFTAGVTGYQAASLTSRIAAPFNIGSYSAHTLLGVLQALAAWTPTGVVNQFDFYLDVELA
jgi:hypothetical protein